MTARATAQQLYGLPGRVRHRLAEMMTLAIREQEGCERFFILPEHLNPGNGNLARVFDCALWDGSFTDPDNPISTPHVYSYDRMTDCVRFGFVLSREDRRVWVVDCKLSRCEIAARNSTDINRQT